MEYVFTGANTSSVSSIITTGNAYSQYAISPMSNMKQYWSTPTIIESKPNPKDFYKRITLETEEWLKDVLVY